MKHFITISDASAEQLRQMLQLAAELRSQREAGRANEPILAGMTLAMLFEKPSLRTRVSFEQAMYELGGRAIVLGQHEVGLGQRESVADATRVLAGMVQAIAARVFDHANLEQMAAHSDVPVINMLSDRSHPCQALADVLTMQDAFGADLRGRHLTFIGDGNNVARSLANIAGRLGFHFTLAGPGEYHLPRAEIESLRASYPDSRFEMTEDAGEAVRQADALYTDTFVSMGQEAEKQARLDRFAPYQLNEELLAAAPAHAIVLHCLPAYRGVEITDSVMDGSQSRVFAQAHNRLHAQKGLLAAMLGNR